MEYNTQREQLKISDYGRHVAKMVDYCKTLEDREERTAMANTIVDVMAHVNPKIKERAEYKHILWDHLMMLAHYDLDVDCPYEINREEVENLHPQPLHYSEGSIRYRHYGRALENMVKAVAEMPHRSSRGKGGDVKQQQLDDAARTGTAYAAKEDKEHDEHRADDGSPGEWQMEKTGDHGRGG